MTVHALPAGLVPARQRWYEERQDIELRSVFGSQILQSAPPVWATELEFHDRAESRTGDFKALQMQLAGGNQVEVHDHARPEPKGTYRGTLTLAEDVEQGATSMTLVRANDNLFTYPEAFNDSSWQKIRTTIAKDVGVAPDGTPTADFLIENTDNAVHYVYKGQPVVAGVTYSYSVFAKAGTRTIASIFFYSTNGAFASGYAVFDLTAGLMTAQSSPPISGGIEAYPDGWFRLYGQRTALASVNGNTSVAPGGVAAYPGDGASGIYIWGAKLNVGAVPTDYGFGQTLLTGDLLGIGTGSKQQVVMVTEDAVSYSQGYITVNFEHPLRNAFSAGTEVRWDKPKALFRMRKNRAAWSHDRHIARGMTLDLVESVYP